MVQIGKEYRRRDLTSPLGNETNPSSDGDGDYSSLEALLRPADLSLAQRVQILYDLCNFCLEAAANIEAILSFDRNIEWVPHTYIHPYIHTYSLSLCD